MKLYFICSCFIVMHIICNALKLKLNPEYLKWQGCISHHEAKIFLLHKEKVMINQKSIQLTASIDLSKTKQEIIINTDGLNLNDKLLATWDELEDIANDKKRGCYSLFDDGSKPYRISTLSKTSGTPCALLPPLKTGGAPSINLGGFTMHRIAGDNMNPTIDTSAKISSIPLFPGAKVLDTCCGLGYTAISAAEKVGLKGFVTTIEYDEASIEMCAHNPWSQKLFDGSVNIDILHGDACKLIQSFPTASFHAIIHDPPARALCKSDLYGLQFYTELKRVLKPGGLIYHYIGNPNSQESGRLYRGIKNRLEEAGFVNLAKVERAFGIIGKTTDKSIERTRKRFFKRTMVRENDDHLDLVDSSDN